MSYTIRLSSQARRALTTELPETVAAACAQFIFGALSTSPFRVGQQLRPPAHPKFAARRGDFRIIYQILETEIVVEVISIRHRRDAYRTEGSSLQPPFSKPPY